MDKNRLERMYEGIQARKSLLGCISRDTCLRELNVKKTVFGIMYKKEF